MAGGSASAIPTATSPEIVRRNHARTGSAFCCNSAAAKAPQFSSAATAFSTAFSPAAIRNLARVACGKLVYKPVSG
jgi:hypothetical protein